MNSWNTFEYRFSAAFPWYVLSAFLYTRTYCPHKADSKKCPFGSTVSCQGVCVLFAMNCLNFLWISVSHIHWLTNYLGSIKKILLLTFTTTQWLHAVAVFRPINYRDVSSVSSAPLIYDQFVSLHFNWLKFENLLLHKRVDGIWISYEIALSDIFFYAGLDNFLYSKSPEIKWFFVFCGIRAYERVHKRYIVPGSNRYWGPWGW